MTDSTAASEDPITDEERTPRAWRRVLPRLTLLLGRNRVLAYTAGVAVLALAAGLIIGRALAPAATSAPPAGPVTAPVAFGLLTNEISLRGDVVYAGAIDVTVETGELAGPAVVTGQVPDVGAELNSLSVALEVAGRPLIVLPGDLPAYRTLRFGLSGPDVVQLKTALTSVGIDGGDPADPRFDEKTADGVAALYQKAGYPPPESEEGAVDAVRSAQDAVTAAEQSLAAADTDLAAATAPPLASEATAAANAVRSAQRALDSARAEVPQDPNTIADAKDALALARNQQDELLTPSDTALEELAVKSASTALDQARQALTRTQQEALPELPAAEVLFLGGLPRRVDAVAATRGAVLSAAAMTVSGAELRVTGSVSKDDASLLHVGDEAFFTMPDGAEKPASVTALTPPAEDGGGPWTFELSPGDLSPEQVTEIQDQSLVVRIPVDATDGDVLSVPAAALTAGPGGETRVEVEPDTGEETRLVIVEPGLVSPDGVEVTVVEGELQQGDRVVIGR